jgi:hypothetical protein
MFEEGKYYLMFLERRLEVRPGSLSLGEYDIDISLHVWREYIRVEECRYLSDALTLAREIAQAEDYDYRVKFVGIFRGHERVYWPDDIHREIQEAPDSHTPVPQ